MTIYDLRARLPSSPCKFWYMLHYFRATRDCNSDERKILNSISKNINARVMTASNREENMPHTLGEYIILPSNFKDLTPQVQTSIVKHELVHIEQRKRKINECIDIVSLQPLRRINPDTNDCFTPGYLWVYSSEYPKNVNDVIKLSEYEHPFEEEAYQSEKN
jgi:hypothetical protein